MEKSRGANAIVDGDSGALTRVVQAGQQFFQQRFVLYGETLDQQVVQRFRQPFGSGRGRVHGGSGAGGADLHGLHARESDEEKKGRAERETAARLDGGNLNLLIPNTLGPNRVGERRS